MTTTPSKRPAPSTSKEDMLAEVKRRADEAKRRIEALRRGTPVSATPSPAPAQNGATHPPTPSAAAPPAITMPTSLADIKARMAAAMNKPKADAPPERPPARVAQEMPAPAPDFKFQEPEDTKEKRAGRGGMNIALHPMLRGDAPDTFKRDDRNNRDKRGRQHEEKKEVSNPYLSADGPSAPARKRRDLNFTHDLDHRPAMEAAAEMRRKAALEEMKAKIQASAAKAGLDEAADTTCFAVSEPPEVEWWDEALQTDLGFNENITNLIVHPVLIDPAQEKFTTTKAPTMYLTKKELKKMRRNRRAEVHKEEQTKIRLGLAPVPAPKINHKNVMRVYGELAVQGPSAVEEMVNRQMAERQHKHETMNAERQLSKEEKAEKTQEKAAANAAMGLYLQVYKINLKREDLLNKHRFLINKNAQQWADMHGFGLVTPNFTLVLVEGGAKSTGQYKKLMLRRIKWQAILEGGGEILDKEAWEGVEDETCVLVHEGQIRERRFKKWGNVREADTEVKAREAMVKAKLENFWVMAKSLEKGAT
jgi:U4/U6 small nuclear ribonucleoprotein PRP3